MDASIITTQLMAYVDHLESHPHLVEFLDLTTMDHRVGNDRRELCALVFDGADGGRLYALAAWARTLVDVDNVRLRTSDGHLGLVGRLADGTPIDVHTVLLADEIDLLRANTTFEVGATFPVELLFRLTSAADAEDNADRPDTRTCWMPGDQEHDHAMCQDVIADELQAERSAVETVPAGDR